MKNPKHTASYPQVKAAHTAYKALIKNPNATPKQKAAAKEDFIRKTRLSLRQAGLI